MEEEEKLFNPDILNLKKKYPEYINNWVFRGLILFLIIFTIFTLKINGGLSFVYIENSLNRTVINQYRSCDIDKGIIEECVKNPPKELINLCGGDCPSELKPFEVIGKKPLISIDSYINYVLMLIFASFIVNHLLFMLKKKPSYKNICINCGKDFIICECDKYDRK